MSRSYTLPRAGGRTHFTRASVLLLLLGNAWLVGCHGGLNGEGPYTVQTERHRDSIAAERLTRQAVELVGSDPVKAETLFREALTADLYHGPAHNNLGVIYLTRGELYSAASEFEWARKLMPGSPDPRVNLALTLERAGRVDDALGAYASALEASPQYLAAVQGIARLQVRHNRRDDRTTAYLRDIALRGESPEWREWAHKELIASIHVR